MATDGQTYSLMIRDNVEYVTMRGLNNYDLNIRINTLRKWFPSLEPGDISIEVEDNTKS